MAVASLISYPQAILLGLLQGVSELFPISSLGQSVILPSLLGWNIHQKDPYFLSFLVATHLATAVVLLLFFRRDWTRILRGLGRSLRDRGIAEVDADEIPELLAHQGDGVRGQALAGALCAALTAWLAVRFLMRFFETQTLMPFAIYCLLAEAAATTP